VGARYVKEAVIMSSIVQSIDVDVPVRTAYDQWTQFEEFPRFMEGVERVAQLDDANLEWTADVGGQRRTWRAQIVDQQPDQRIAWESTEGARNAGIVTFHPLDEGRTRITLQIDTDPEGPMENVGDALGLVERRVEGDLKRFKEFIEQRGAPTGAWRGRVESDMSWAWRASSSNRVPCGSIRLPRRIPSSGRTSRTGPRQEPRRRWRTFETRAMTSCSSPLAATKPTWRRRSSGFPRAKPSEHQRRAVGS
jgi:uncharacterized membrane protein